MKTVFKDLWEIHASLKDGEYVAITTNGATRKDGCAVMGRGCALEAAQKFPGLQQRFGAQLLKYGNHVFVCPEYRLITFPVKVSWEQSADLKLIMRSCQELLKEMKKRKISHVFLPCPGCGNGRLSPSDVLPVLEASLKDSPVTIVQYPKA